VYTAAAGSSALSAVTRSASDAEPNMKEFSRCEEYALQRSPKQPKSPMPAAAMQTTTSTSKIHLGIPSCSASGKARTNGLQIITNLSHGEGPSGFATRKMKHIIPVAASARA